MQQLVIEPSRSLGPFVLGASLNEVVAIVQKDSAFLRENHIIFDQQVSCPSTRHSHTPFHLIHPNLALLPSLLFMFAIRIPCLVTSSWTCWTCRCVSVSRRPLSV
jgi:flagellar biosynthesis regulator FlbT